MGVQSVQLLRALHLHNTWLMLLHCHLEILNYFGKGPLLLFVLGPAHYVAGPDPWI